MCNIAGYDDEIIVNDKINCKCTYHMVYLYSRWLVIFSSDAARNSNASTKAAFYFSHAESVFPMTVKLGLRYDEEPLKHDNYEKMINGRKWKTHVFNSFASNIVAVLYKWVCECNSK